MAIRRQLPRPQIGPTVATCEAAGDSWGSVDASYDILPGKDWILRCASNGKIALRCIVSERKVEFVARCREYCRKVSKKRGGVTLRVRGLEGEVEYTYKF